MLKHSFMSASIGSIFRMFSAGREKKDEGPGEGEGRQPGVSIPGLHHGSVAGPGPCNTGPCPTFSTADSLPPAGALLPLQTAAGSQLPLPAESRSGTSACGPGCPLALACGLGACSRPAEEPGAGGGSRSPEDVRKSVRTSRPLASRWPWTVQRANRHAFVETAQRVREQLIRIWSGPRDRPWRWAGSQVPRLQASPPWPARGALCASEPGGSRSSYGSRFRPPARAELSHRRCDRRKRTRTLPLPCAVAAASSAAPDAGPSLF